MSDPLRDELRELAQDIPWDRPDAARRDALRSSLLIAAADAPPRKDRKWLVAGAAFAAGVLAAAAVAAVVVRRSSETRSDAAHPVALAGRSAQITTTAASRIEHQVVATPTGVDEIVRVLDGTVRLTVDDVRKGDHVRVRTRDAEVEGAGDYEVVVAAEALSAVTVRSGTAHVRVEGQRAVFLSTGQTWRAAVVTDDLSPRPAKVAAADTVTTTPDTTKPDGTPDARTTDTSTNARATDTTSAHTSTKSDGPTRSAAMMDATGRDATNAAATRPDATARPDATKVDATKPDAARSTKVDAAAKVDATKADTTAKADATKVDVTRPDATRSTKVDAATKADATKVDVRLDATRSTTKADAAARTDVAAKADATKADATAKRDGGSTTKPDPAISTGSATVAAQKKVRSETERRFEAGWKLLRDGKAREAAVELAAAADASPDDALAADARYFQAVALVRSGQGRDAENVLVAFLDHAPKSLRRGRAAVLLGRLLAERGDVESARAWYKSAVDDPDAGVAAAARAGLDALPPKR